MYPIDIINYMNDMYLKEPTKRPTIHSDFSERYQIGVLAIINYKKRI
jgi:hypothetical protein